MRKTMLKTVLAVVLISLCVIPFAYSAMSPAVRPSRPKIFFTWAPGGAADFSAPPDRPDVDGMFVWAANMIGSTYGPFTLAFVEYYTTDSSGVTHNEDHWYTTDLAAGRAYAALTVKVYTMMGEGYIVYDSWDVTKAKITMTSSSEDQLSVTVSVKGKPLFTVQYAADTNVDIKSDLVGGICLTSPIFLCGTKAFRPLANAEVTGIPVGNFQEGQFRYTQTELYDPSLMARENP
jgi:hypothetical protein